MTALSLSRVGVTVTMLERSDDNGRTGASLSAIEGMLERLTGRPPTADEPAMPGGIQTWVAVHDRLRAAVDRDRAIRSSIMPGFAKQARISIPHGLQPAMDRCSPLTW